jgi:hypothetical protein
MLFNLGILSSKVLQRADACVVGYSEEGIASFAGGLNLEIISVDQ